LKGQQPPVATDATDVATDATDSMDEVFQTSVCFLKEVQQFSSPHGNYRPQLAPRETKTNPFSQGPLGSAA